MSRRSTLIQPKFAPFHVGQRVRFTERAKGEYSGFVLRSYGVVAEIEDLSKFMPDDPEGTRAFALFVRLDGRKTPTIWGNGAYFAPLDEHPHRASSMSCESM